MTSQITVQNLTKTYRVPERESGLAASAKSLFHRSYRDVEAVREISFQVKAGPDNNESLGIHHRLVASSHEDLFAV